jgi:tRNA dimethylallyltransferase
MAAVDAPLVAVVGPTASGKSALALQVAEECGGEIVSCDSLQVYRGLDIGSAKPTAEERRRVRHHLIDVRAPDEIFSAADYSRMAREALADIRARGRLAIVAGGTGLYLRALLEGLFEGPSRDDVLRARLEAIAERFGDARLHRLLRRVDSEAAARIHVTDRLRIVRAIEVFHATGRPLSQQHRQGAEPLRGYRTLVVGLLPPRDELRRRVEARTRAMFEQGLIEEVRGLFDRGYDGELRPLQAIGYRQAAAVIEGKMSAASAEQSVVTETMRYAKRQRTWFRHQTGDVRWFERADDAAMAVREFLRDSAFSLSRST